jgi:glycosyltransferase involved in cell wall biosynthesis
VLVLSSRFETCSMATREAMARGRPAVGYAVRGLPANFGAAAASGAAPAGRLVSPDEPEAFTDALRHLLSFPDTRTKMGTAARAHSHSFPTWAEAADRLRAAVSALQDGTE